MSQRCPKRKWRHFQNMSAVLPTTDIRRGKRHVGFTSAPATNPVAPRPDRSFTPTYPTTLGRKPIAATLTIQPQQARTRGKIPIAPAAPPPHTSRDFVPWRFLDAGRNSAWKGSSCRRPKTCTLTDIASQQPTWTDQSFERLFATHFRMRTQQLGVHVAACFCRAETREGRCDRRLDRPWLPTC